MPGDPRTKRLAEGKVPTRNLPAEAPSKKKMQLSENDPRKATLTPVKLKNAGKRKA